MTVLIAWSNGLREMLNLRHLDTYRFKDTTDCELLSLVEVTTSIIISAAISAAVSTILNVVLHHYREQSKSKDK